MTGLVPMDNETLLLHRIFLNRRAMANNQHGEYPGAGAQLGPGMAFGYLAALHATRPDHEQEERQNATRARAETAETGNS